MGFASDYHHTGPGGDNLEVVAAIQAGIFFFSFRSMGCVILLYICVGSSGVTAESIGGVWVGAGWRHGPLGILS